MSFPQMTKTNVVLAVLAVLLALAYYHNLAGLKGLASHVGIEGFQQDKKGHRTYHHHGHTKLVLYFHPSCGHCKKMMPEWHRLEAHHKKGLGKKVEIKKVNAQLNPAAVAAAGVRGFPTVVLSKAGTDKVYTGPRKAEAIEAFINAN
jgi:thiol-disulfide isomerase/thioredoxin